MARQGNTDERRSQIALALKTVMAVRGYEGATVGEIAREAGLAPGLVHYYFDDKLEILRHLCALLSDRMKARAVLFASMAPKKPREQLVALTDSLLAHGPDEDPSAVAAWVAAGAEALREPRAREAYERVLALLFDQLVVSVRAVLGDESRDESEAPVVASALLASVQGYFTLAVAAPGVVPHGTAASALRHMAHGLLDAVPEARRLALDLLDDSRRSPPPQTTVHPMSIAVYAGSFDPVTAGHLSIVLQAVRLFTHLVVLVANNPNKKTLFNVDEREKMLRNAVRLHPNVTVSSTDGFVVEYARKIGATFLVRGIRSATDAVFETSLAQQNRELAPEIATILLPAVATLSEVSSSQLKDLVRRGESTESFCPPEVAAALRERIAEEALRADSTPSSEKGST